MPEFAVKLTDPLHGIVLWDVASGTDYEDAEDTAEARGNGAFTAVRADQLISDLLPNGVGAIDPSTLLHG